MRATAALTGMYGMYQASVHPSRTCLGATSSSFALVPTVPSYSAPMPWQRGGTAVSELYSYDWNLDIKNQDAKLKGHSISLVV